MTISEAAKKKEVVNVVGDVGYKFRKEFDSGWFTGTVEQIRPLAEGGKDRRCVYDDGDSEDLSLIELQTLAILDPNVTKQEPAIGVSSSSSSSSPSSKGRTQNAPMQQNQSSTRHGVNSDETVTSKARGNKSDDTVTSKALAHKIEKRRRDDEEEGEELLQSETRSNRTVDEIYRKEDGHRYESPASAVAASSDSEGGGAYPNEGNAPDDGNADHDDNDGRFSEDDVGRTSVPTQGPPKRLVMKKPSSSSVSTEPPPTKKHQSTTRSRHPCSVGRNTTTITKTAASSVKRKRQTRTILANESLSDEDDDNDEEGLFIEKIVDHRLDEYGKSLYKTRWKGYTARDDTWEPIANVASTGHIDRYVRLQRQKSLLHGDDSAGVAVIEYDDGEREMVDMTIETFRPYYNSDDDEDEDDDNDNVGANGRGRKTTINDYTLLTPGNHIEILWKHANMYFPCKVISWTSLSPRCESGRTTASSFKNNNNNNNNSTGITPDLVISEALGPPVFVAAEAGLGTGGESRLKMIDLTLSDDESNAAPSKKDGSLVQFGIYATSLRKKKNPPIPQERPAETEEEDAPKFVTPLKGTKNKKPTTFDGGNDDSSVSDDDADLFPSNVEGNHFSMLTPSDDDASLFADVSTPSDDDASLFSEVKSLSGVEVGHLTGNIVSSSSGIYEGNADHDDNDSRFSEDDAGRTSVPTQRPPKRLVLKKKLKKENANTLVTQYKAPPEERRVPEFYYLAHILGRQMRKVASTLAEGPPPPVITRGKYKYQILVSYLFTRKAKGYHEDKMGNEYYKSYYLKLSPSTPSVKSALLSIGDFESLTYEHGPHKTHSRLELLVSPSCRPPGGGKSFCFHEIPSDNFDVIDDNGHLGCGFIHPSNLVELLGSSQPAQRVIAIQVRIIGPSKVGVAKGMLFVKEDMEEYKIQVPASMVKVNRSKTTPLHTYVALNIRQCFPSSNQQVMGNLFDDGKKDPTSSKIKGLKPLSIYVRRVLRCKGVSEQTIKQYIDEAQTVIKHGNVDGAKTVLKHGDVVGVSDPTGQIPCGHVFLTGMGEQAPSEVFLTRYPCTEGKDGIVAKVATWQDMTEEAFQFLDSLDFGAVVFALGDSPLPPSINDGDLDGDLYVCIWDPNLLAGITINADDECLGEILSDDLVGTGIQVYDKDADKGKGKWFDAMVMQKLNANLYSVEIGPMNNKKEMTREEIFEGREYILSVVGHRRVRCSKGTKTKSVVQFNIKWATGVSTWWSVEEIRLKYACPPDEIKKYLLDNRLLKNDDLPKTFVNWVKKYMEVAAPLEITKHRVKDKHVEVLCRYSDGDEQWIPMAEARGADYKRFLGAYANEKKLFGKPGWKEVDGLWLEELEDLMCKEVRSHKISNLLRKLHRMWRTAFKESGGNHNDTIIWGRAYKNSLEIEKHGGKIKLPLHLYYSLSKDLQKFVELSN